MFTYGDKIFSNWYLNFFLTFEESPVINMFFFKKEPHFLLLIVKRVIILNTLVYMN